MNPPNLTDASFVEMCSALRRESLVAFLKDQGLTRVEALRLFSGIAPVVAGQEVAEVHKGDCYRVLWKRRYNDAASLSWTLFTLPLAVVHLWHPRDKEIAFTTEHRLRSEEVADYRWQGLAGGGLQVIAGVWVAISLVHLAGSVAVAWVEPQIVWGLAYVLFAASVAWLGHRFYRWAKRFAIPKPFRMYSANGLFEYHGLKRVAD